MAWARGSSRRRGEVAIGGALAGLAAGAGLAYFLDPHRGGARRSRAMEGARRAAHGAERTAGSWPDGATAVALAVGSAAAARALLGRRLLGIPALVAGAALARGVARGALSRAGRAREDASEDASRRTKREASRRAVREREEARDREAHTGGWHPEPEVVEVKSPAELEAGVARASPEPTFASRVSRRGGSGNPGAGARGGRSRRRPDDPPRDAGASPPEQVPRAGYFSPPPGSGVHVDDLGATRAPGEGGEPDEDGGSGSDER